MTSTSVEKVSSSSQRTMFYELCRLCLEKKGVKSIFNFEDLDKVILVITGVHIKRSDNLPQNVCMSCYETLEKANILRTLIINNNRHLRVLFEEELSDSSPAPETSEGTSNKVTTSQLCDEFIDETQPLLSVRKDLFEKTVDSTTPVKETKHKHKGHKERKKSSSDKEKNTAKEKVKRKHDDSTSSRHSTSMESPRKSDVKKIKESPKDNVPDTSEEPKKLKVKRKVIDGVEHFTCLKCFKQFNAWKKFYHHQRQVHTTKSVICPFDACSKRFATKGDLDKHVRTHTGEKPYKCDKCGKSFAQRITMRQHKESVHWKETDSED